LAAGRHPIVVVAASCVDLLLLLLPIQKFVQLDGNHFQLQQI
jgi:hypothetical protein